MIFSIFKKKKEDEVPDIVVNADTESVEVTTPIDRQPVEVANTELVEGEPAEQPEVVPGQKPEQVPLQDQKMVLRTDDLVKIYGKRTVVDHVSINVTQGEIVGLLGPNGAGKTTTFYMTTGLIKPNQGRIFLNDLDITSYPVYKRAQNGIGYLAQEASVFRKLSVEDNIRAVLQMTKKPQEYQREKLESLIAEFNLQKVRKNLGDQLSGGERRRTEIARCLAIDPKFIMLDEPFAGVDPIAVEDIQQVVYHLKEKNIGILITDHNAPETLSITDRAYLLFEGHILFQGTGEELADNPIVREKYLGRNFVYRRKNFD
jgi:lipopolysaccharide export system ATP-binding protein